MVTHVLLTIKIWSAAWIIFVLPYYRTEQSYLTDNYPASVIEDGKLDTVELLTKYGYPSETHFVTTEDSYVLRMHRIPKPNARPVLLMHGLLDSSATWIFLGPQYGLGYYLYENGYDIWLGNVRGTRYSRNHSTISPDSEDFWNFSWHEIGYYDLPAMVDYVLNQTSYNKLSYYGHSQGTTTFWVMTSMRPQYNDKIAIMHALAPVAFMGNIKAPMLPLAKNFAQMSLHEFLPHSLTIIFSNFCFQSKRNVDMCLNILLLILGNDPDHFNATMLPTLLGHLPAGCNYKQPQHYMQLIDSKRFRQFDYGPVENKKRYHRAQPPDYPLSKITAPVALYYTYNDYLSSYVDVRILAKLLPNVVEDRLYPYKRWNHVSICWRSDARKLAHYRMLEVMRKYEGDIKKIQDETTTVQDSVEELDN